MKLQTRFWKYVKKAKGCWLWTGSTCKGYGIIWCNGKLRRAARLSYMIHKGEIPLKMLVCHRCDNTLCVNPSHLFLGTNKDNTQDAKRKGRLATGDRHGLRLHPERAACGDNHGFKKHPERVASGTRHGSFTHPERVSRGEHRHCAKLTEKAVKEIRVLYSNGVKCKELSSTYKVGDGAIMKVVKRKTWKHVN